MATLPDGWNGSIRGRLGNVVWYPDPFGRIICRTIGAKTSSKGGEFGNQKGTELITTLLKPMVDFVRVGFQNVPAGMPWYPYQHASSVNKKNAVKGVFPNQEIDYEKVKFSVGDMPLPINAKVTLKNNTLEFTWDADLETEGNFSRDQVMLVAYFPETHKAINVLSGARRTEEKETIKLPRFTKEVVLETYMSFIGDDRKTLSNSVYTGQVIWTNK